MSKSKPKAFPAIPPRADNAIVAGKPAKTARGAKAKQTRVEDRYGNLPIR